MLVFLLYENGKLCNYKFGAFISYRITQRKEIVYSFLVISVIFLYIASKIEIIQKGSVILSVKRSNLKLITTALLLGLILSSLDQTILSTAMPTIIQELDGLSMYSWVFTVYMLATTTTMPIYGKMADLFGRRKMYLIGLSLFLIGSMLCGFANNITQLIIFRGIQGLGAGALMPVSMTIVGDLYPPEKRGKFMGLFGAVFAISSIFGPTLGGFIVEYWNWSWIFYINLPFGIPALIIMAKSLKESKSQVKRSIDWFGALTLSGGLIAILLALVLGGNTQIAGTNYSWSSLQIIGLFSIGFVLLVLFLWIETKAKEPIIPLHLFRIRVIALGSITGFFMSAGMFGAIVYIPLFVQNVIGISPSTAGYILTPLMLSVVVTSTLGGRLMSKVSFRSILIPSMLLMTIGFILLSQINANTTSWEMVCYMFITGLGMGAIYPVLGTAAQSAVDAEARGVATSSSQFFRSMGGTVGVSILGSFLAQQLALEPTALSKSLSDVFFFALIFVCIGLIACLFIGNARLIKKSE
jgi:EmrB/QacA subfamily drug resistance transporter